MSINTEMRPHQVSFRCSRKCFSYFHQYNSNLLPKFSYFIAWNVFSQKINKQLCAYQKSDDEIFVCFRLVARAPRGCLGRRSESKIVNIIFLIESL